MSRKRKDENESLTRIAIVNGDRCKPKKCRLECKRFCPVVRMGKLCIEVENTSSIAYISETLCNGCGICVKKCPYGAISIINLPSNLNSETTHRYGPNQFKLHRLPTPRPNQVLGLVGTNGIGKSTALKVLAGRLKPNLGKYNEPPDWSDILVNFRGSELQNYFTKVLEDNLKPVIKPQYVDQLPRAVRGIVGEVIDSKNESGKKDYYVDLLDLRNVLGNEVEKLSGGELQRFAICITSISNGDVFMFDEPSSYLDVKQRLNAARAIRSLIETTDTKFVICVEHDLSVLDYLSDFVCVLYGVPGAYGVVTLPFGVREGINIFLAGFVHTENLRFRETSLSFKVKDNTERDDKRSRSYSYPQMTKTVGHFQLDIDAGEFTDSEIIVLLGENGTGKTTFIRMLAGILKPDNDIELPELKISYKPQQISPKFKGSVENLLDKKLGNAWRDQQFKSDVVRPLGVEEFLDQEVNVLSGGEIQRVAIILALGKAADIYLIDEPSAYLDSEQRIICAKVIKRFILHSKKSAFIVEHDFIMATYLSDRVIVYEGQPSVKCTATTPRSLIDGMNRFLQLLDITFRRDRENFRPRINKYGSQKDREQKASGNYFISDD